jgi:hypothetical protein
MNMLVHHGKIRALLQVTDAQAGDDERFMVHMPECAVVS